jgi:hypothetical protein
MVEQTFGALFLVALFAPVAAVFAGVALLAWPHRTITRHQKTMHHEPSHA